MVSNETIFGLVEKLFILLLSSILNASNHTKCVSLSNQKCMIQHTLTNIHPNEYSHKFHYYQFSIKLNVLEVAILWMTCLVNYAFQIKQKIHVCKKDYVWNPSKCICENGEYLASIMDDSMILCDEIIKSYDEEIKTILTNFSEKNVTCKTQNLYVLLAFLLVTTSLLTAISIYFYMIKYLTKHSLPFHDIKNLNKSILII